MSVNKKIVSDVAHHTEAELLNDIALPINRCNVPARVLASLAFQQHPVPLQIDAIHNRHPDLFDALSKASDHDNRADYFREFMAFRFRLPEGKYKERWKDDPPPRPKLITADCSLVGYSIPITVRGRPGGLGLNRALACLPVFMVSLFRAMTA